MIPTGRKRNRFPGLTYNSLLILLNIVVNDKVYGKSNKPTYCDVITQNRMFIQYISSSSQNIVINELVSIAVTVLSIHT